MHSATSRTGSRPSNTASGSGAVLAGLVSPCTSHSTCGYSLRILAIPCITSILAARRCELVCCTFHVCAAEGTLASPAPLNTTSRGTRAEKPVPLSSGGPGSSAETPRMNCSMRSRALSTETSCCDNSFAGDSTSAVAFSAAAFSAAAFSAAAFSAATFSAAAFSIALTPSPTAFAPSRPFLPTKVTPSTVAEPTTFAPSRPFLPTKVVPSTVAVPTALTTLTVAVPTALALSTVAAPAAFMPSTDCRPIKAAPSPMALTPPTVAATLASTAPTIAPSDFEGPARMMILNSARSISPSLFVSAVAIISSMAFSARPFLYLLRMYAFISSGLILPLLSLSTLANAASSPASDLSISSPKIAWKPAVTPSVSNVFSSPEITRLPVAFMPSPTAAPAELKNLPVSAAPIPIISVISPAFFVGFVILSVSTVTFSSASSHDFSEL